MAKKKDQNFLMTAVGALGWPLFWGMAMWVGFYALLTRGPIDAPLLQRYFAGHPVEYLEAAMFFVGIAALALKGASVLKQFSVIGGINLPAVPRGGMPVDDAPSLLSQLSQWPATARNSLLGNRIVKAIEHIYAQGSPQSLNEELRELSDQDADRAYDSYALVRIIVWATPMLGFLGTVIGITLALGDLSPELLVEAPKEAMKGLVGGLGVAFDTTALALSLSILLMFVQFFVSRVEQELLATVDHRTHEALSGRFQQLGTNTDPHLMSVTRMLERVSASNADLVDRQAELWKKSMEEAQQKWVSLSNTAGRQLEGSLIVALDSAVKTHASELVKAEHVAADRAKEQVDELRNTLRENADVISRQHAALLEQAKTLNRACEAAGEVARLESSLNDNLQALAGSRNFEETVMSLSAAIHLLNSRLADAGFRGGVNLSPRPWKAAGETGESGVSPRTFGGSAGGAPAPSTDIAANDSGANRGRAA